MNNNYNLILSQLFVCLVFVVYFIHDSRSNRRASTVTWLFHIKDVIEDWIKFSFIISTEKKIFFFLVKFRLLSQCYRFFFLRFFFFYKYLRSRVLFFYCCISFHFITVSILILIGKLALVVDKNLRLNSTFGERKLEKSKGEYKIKS